MIGSTLLLMVGLVDLVGSGTRAMSFLLRLLVVLGVPALAYWGLGLDPLLAGACLAPAVAWIWATTSTSTKSSRKNLREPRQPSPRLWPVILLFVLVFGISAYDRTFETASGFLVDFYSRTDPRFAASFPLPIIVAATAVAIFLTKSANNVTVSALRWAKKEDTKAEIQDAVYAESGSGVPESKWELFVSNRKVASLRAGDKPVSGPALKGGRLIGPIERLLVVVLAFAGAWPIIAGLAAAKGVIRFPEISEDRTSGSKAEEFLVGSLTSWAMSAIAILYLILVRSSL